MATFHGIAIHGHGQTYLSMKEYILKMYWNSMPPENLSYGLDVEHASEVN